MCTIKFLTLPILEESIQNSIWEFFKRRMLESMNVYENHVNNKTLEPKQTPTFQPFAKCCKILSFFVLVYFCDVQTVSVSIYICQTKIIPNEHFIKKLTAHSLVYKHCSIPINRFTIIHILLTFKMFFFPHL